MTSDFITGCMLDKKSAEVMYQYLKELPKKGRLLETGTGWGHSSQFFSKVLPGWSIYTVDGFGLYGDGRIYSNNLIEMIEKVEDVVRNHKPNVIQILGNSQAINWELPLDVLYIDADHTYEGCKADFDLYSPFVVKGGLVIFDDYIQDNNPANGVKKVVDGLVGYEILYTGIAAITRKV